MAVTLASEQWPVTETGRPDDDGGRDWLHQKGYERGENHEVMRSQVSLDEAEMGTSESWLVEEIPGIRLDEPF